MAVKLISWICLQYFVKVCLKKHIFRGRHWRCSLKKGALRNFTKITGKHLCQSLLFNKFAGLRPATLLKKRPWHRCFPVNFVNILRAPFLQKIHARGCRSQTLHWINLWRWLKFLYFSQNSFSTITRNSS